MFLIMLQSNKMELPVAGTVKYEMYVVIRFLHAEGQPAVWNSIDWSLKIQDGMPPTL